MIKMHVDRPQRYAKMRAHTATHLLHFALEQVLQTTKQAWSLVDEDYVRFDFSSSRPLEDEEMQHIHTLVNTRIRANVPVVTEELAYDEAVKKWAKAFFEDTYGERVRMVSIRTHDATLSSQELCGGTHVAHTGDIGAFALLQQESVASGTRRITAVTGPAVADYLLRAQDNIHTFAHQLGCQPKQVGDKINKLQEQIQTMQEYTHHLEQTHYRHLLRHADFPHDETVDAYICLESLNIADQHIKTLIPVIKEIFPSSTVLIVASNASFALWCGQDTRSAKELATQRDVKWGGSDQLVQGKDPRIIERIPGSAS